MIRMEIALFLVVAFVAVIYFTSERKDTPLHRTFFALLCVTLFHLVFDTITVITVNNLESVPVFLNDIFHRLFIGSMIVIFYLFYRYIAILVDEENGKKMKFDLFAKIYLIPALIADLVLPITYTVTPDGNYSDGIYVAVCYLSVMVFFAMGTFLFLYNWKVLQKRKRMAIGIACSVELIGTIVQGIHHEWLTSGMGITLITLAFYLILENLDILRAELFEQKMSMLYLKSQINPHFLYNTLDTIRIQAQINGDNKVSDLLMRLVDFFRMSVKMNRQVVELDDEIDVLEAYMELMCYRYPGIECEYDIDPELGNEKVPNFILQPIVENSLLHGLKEVGYNGRVKICARRVNEKMFEISVSDSGIGFREGVGEKIEDMLKYYERYEAKLEGNSIGILNIQKRIKLLCGKEYGLSYTENSDCGVTAHIYLPVCEVMDQAARNRFFGNMHRRRL